jgi:2-(1,2-epoxy-1,2-dihydrophenyl)acetyl-CoA isomerase
MPGEGLDCVALSIACGVATITLNRPQQLNAITLSLHAALRQTLDRIERDRDVRAIILTGAGRAFCAGQDLGERAAAFAGGQHPDLGASLEQHYNPLLRRITALPMPIIAAVNGMAYGAGAGLALACDIVLAAEAAAFQFGFVKLGLGPDCGVSALLPQCVGLQRALELALTGRVVDSTEALRLGLTSRVVPTADLLSVAQLLGEQLAGQSSASMAAIKLLLRRGATSDLGTALNAERDAQGALAGSGDYRAAVLTFAQKSGGKR